MSMLKVYDMKGASVGEFDFADDLLALKKGSQAVHDAIVAYLAGQRSGTASTLRKGEVAGSNKKPWRQKGTGRARAGYRQSPVWRGGGVAFGPHPRSFELKINKKAARLAFRRAFSEKVTAGDVKVVDEIAISEPKTKHFSALLKALGINKPVLLVLDKVDRNVALASRNMPTVEVAAARNVNVYQIVRYPVMIVSKSGLEHLKGRFAEKDGGGK